MLVTYYNLEVNNDVFSLFFCNLFNKISQIKEIK